MSDAQGGVARDGVRSVQDLRDAIGRHVESFALVQPRSYPSASSSSARCSPGWIAVNAQSNAPSDSQQSPHLTAPAIGRPLEANPPLIVNAEAVLALAVAYQRFKTVPR
jgi:hypothetical protein